jgi:hypothetical protein
LAIIAAVVASRAFSTNTYSLKSTAEVIKTHLRLAQTRAMSTNQVWGISFDSSNTYFMFRNGSVANQVSLPGQDDVIVTLPAGVSVTSGVIVSFDLFGKPYTDAAATALQGADRTITVSDGGTENITITKNTGFIP